jgi:hypothetical protein
MPLALRRLTLGLVLLGGGPGVCLPRGGTTKLPSAFSTGWRGEWLAPEGNGLPVAARAGGQRSFAAPAPSASDAVLLLWRE